MAQAVVTCKIMPDNVEADLESIESAAKKKIAAFAGEGDTRTEIEPVAFGLKALRITFVMDESLGSPDGMAQEISDMDDVMSCEIVDVRRAIG